jgi:hypothetical protein
MTAIQQASSANILIRQLSEQDFALLQPNLERVALGHRQSLYESNRTTRTSTSSRKASDR